jgi:hypothetical protein
MVPLLIFAIVSLVVGLLWSALDSYTIPERGDYDVRWQAILQFLLILAGIVFIALTLTKKI